MSRPKRARRFEPRFGVSREMLAVETGYVAKEVDDYSLLSLNELREKEAELRKAWRVADEMTESALPRRCEREQQVLRRLIIRDMYHLLELYSEFLNRDGSKIQQAPLTFRAIAKQTPAERLPFSEWLFGDLYSLPDAH